MFDSNSFGKTIDILSRSMDNSILRRNVLANNLANSKTPGYKRSDVNFEAELARAVQSENEPVFQNNMSRKNHLKFHRTLDYKKVSPRVVLDYTSQMNNNGNNVDMEEEVFKITKNQMMYEMMTRAASYQFKQIDIVAN